MAVYLTKSPKKASPSRLIQKMFFYREGGIIKVTTLLREYECFCTLLVKTVGYIFVAKCRTYYTPNKRMLANVRPHTKTMKFYAHRDMNGSLPTIGFTPTTFKCKYSFFNPLRVHFGTMLCRTTYSLFTQVLFALCKL